MLHRNGVAEVKGLLIVLLQQVPGLLSCDGHIRFLLIFYVILWKKTAGASPRPRLSKKSKGFSNSLQNAVTFAPHSGAKVLASPPPQRQ